MYVSPSDSLYATFNYLKEIFSLEIEYKMQYSQTRLLRALGDQLKMFVIAVIRYNRVWL